MILYLANGLAPTQAIGVAIPIQNPTIIRSIHSKAGLSKNKIINQIIKTMPAEIDFTEKEIDHLYYLSIECINNFLSKEELITKISHLRGGSLDIIAAFGLICFMIILLNNNGWGLGFQPNLNVIIPPHLQLFYGNQQPGNHFGYGKGADPRSITVTGLTQNAGSEKKNPSSGS